MRWLLSSHIVHFLNAILNFVPKIRYMIDMQGQFPESMLRNGEKTEKYFTRVHLPQCPLQYIRYPHGFPRKYEIRSY